MAYKIVIWLNFYVLKIKGALPPLIFPDPYKVSYS